MIEKLKNIPIDMNGEPSIVWVKINELCDTVNDITDWIKRTDETIVKYGIKPIENTIISKMKKDPYAEQRKWIGKLCRFWDDECVSNYISLLKQIDDDDTPFVDANDVCWERCEPVKPDDDIIYKDK